MRVNLLCLFFVLAVIAAPGAQAGRDDDGLRGFEITSERDAETAQPREDLSKGAIVGRKRFSARFGRQAAAKYMEPRRSDSRATPTDAGSTAGPAAGSRADADDEDAPTTRGRSVASDHYLALHVGWFVNDNAYKFGVPDNQTNVGRWTLGLTYRVGEWVNSMDLLFRFDVARLALAEGGVTKFSIMPIVTFPDASSRFPLYFGVGLGLGVFGNQIPGESTLALDYSLIAGARFFNLWGQTGLFVEGGIKNHLHLLSDGQFNGTFISSGFIFTF